MAHSHLEEGGRIHLKNKTIHLKHNTPFHATKGSPWKFQTEKQVLRGHLWLLMSYLTTLILGQKFTHRFLRFYVLDTGPDSLVFRLTIFDGTKGNTCQFSRPHSNQGLCLEGSYLYPLWQVLPFHSKAAHCCYLCPCLRCLLTSGPTVVGPLIVTVKTYFFLMTQPEAAFPTKSARDRLPIF